MSESNRVTATLDVGGESFEALGYDLERRLSAVEVLRCVVHRPDGQPVEPDSILGKRGSFELRSSGDEQQIVFLGEVVAARHRSDAKGHAVCEVRVKPPLWRLSQQRNSRTFQNQSVPDIVRSVLEGSGIAAAQQEWPSSSFPPKTYVVQHRESDLEFCERLLSEAGLYYSMRHDAGADAPVVCFENSPTGFSGDKPTLPFRDTFGHEAIGEAASHVRRAGRVTVGRVAVRDYDPLRPQLKLEGSVTGHADDESLEVYEYPARQLEPDQISERAQVLSESLSAERDVLAGQTGSLRLSPGHQFELEEHPYEPMNGTYLVTSLRFSGERGGEFALDEARQGFRHRCDFEAVPAGVQYRPPHRLPARQSAGLQTALTTGGAGEEIKVDDHGRVKILYPWDRKGARDEGSSTWVRTSQVPTGGSMLLPRVGWEVTVAHSEGDVDTPVVMGRLYNGVTPPPYKLPDHAASSSLQTNTTPGGGSTNELRMSDTKGNEHMLLNASRDMTVDVGHNTTQSVGNDHKIKVGSNQKFSSTDSVQHVVGANQKLDVGANQSVKVGTLMVEQIGADHSLSVGANRSHMIGGDHRRTIDGASNHEVGGNEIAVVVGDVSNSTAAAYSHTVGAAFIQMAGADRSLLVGGARSEVTGAAKVILAKGNLGLEAGVLSLSTGGAVVANIKGDASETSAQAYTETVAGANSIKAKNVVFEAQTEISITMGGASIKMSPADVKISGAAIKIDGNVVDLGIVKDN
jgi:type VI secretion system secreted protein VgrG